jgi:hypothetical protein
MADTMSDEQLAAEMHIAVELVPKLSEKARAAYENLIRVGRELAAWEAGVGPKPEGVIVCRAKGKWHG